MALHDWRKLAIIRGSYSHARRLSRQSIAESVATFFMTIRRQFSLLELLGIVSFAGVFAFIWSLSELDGAVKLIASSCLATFGITYVFRCGAMMGILAGVAVWNGILIVRGIMDRYNVSEIAAALLFLTPGLMLFGIVPIIVSWWIAWNLSKLNSRPDATPNETNLRP